VVPEKRKLMVVGAAIAAAFALPGCAPAGYNAADYGSGGAQPAANAQTAAPGTPAQDDAAGKKDDGAAKQDDAAGPGAKLTTELRGTTVKRMGSVVENQDGFVLYRFDADVAGATPKSNCNGACAKVWPPALTEGARPKLAGVDAAKVGTVTREDGTKQLTVNGWPVYTYVGDKKAGSWKGQNVNGKWFVITPTGSKNLTCLPKISKPVAPPATGGTGSTSGSDFSY
jgi:predicted lipoprotein with Yx(FWY)xxD motif